MVKSVQLGQQPVHPAQFIRLIAVPDAQFFTHQGTLKNCIEVFGGILQPLGKPVFCSTKGHQQLLQLCRAAFSEQITADIADAERHIKAVYIRRVAAHWNCFFHPLFFLVFGLFHHCLNFLRVWLLLIIDFTVNNDADRCRYHKAAGRCLSASLCNFETFAGTFAENNFDQCFSLISVRNRFIIPF